MSVDLSEYSTGKRIYIKRMACYAVYIVCPVGEDSPCKVGYAFDLPTRISQLQSGNWNRIEVNYVLWAPGRAVAITIENEAHRAFHTVGMHVSGEWFDCRAAWAVDTIEAVAKTWYPSLEFKTHAQMISFLKRKNVDASDISEKSASLTDFVERAMGEKFSVGPTPARDGESGPSFGSKPVPKIKIYVPRKAASAG